MIIKIADDKQVEIQTLQNLLNHPEADTNTKKRVEQEIRNIRAGIRGEEEAAYEMKVRWGDSKNWVIIHDLRVEHGGLVAQIDHLLINRVLEFWVCESKHFSEGISINAQGEFTAFSSSKAYGVPSPIEQNNKHLLILSRIFESGIVKLPKRLGFTMLPELKSLVLVSKHARISRPKAKIDGLNTIIKNDQLYNAIQKSNEDDSGSFLQLARVIGSDTLEELAHEIVKLHKPLQFNWTAKFGLSAIDSCQSIVKAVDRRQQMAFKAKVIDTEKQQREININAENRQVAIDNLRNQGFLILEVIEKTAIPPHSFIVEPEAKTNIKTDNQSEQPVPPKNSNSKIESNESSKSKQKLICYSCGDLVTYNMAKFCWLNKPKFGGNVYCMECQKKI